MTSSKVVIGRKWSNPQIYAYVDGDKIEMQISLEDFLTGLVDEIGSPATLLTKAALKARVLAASRAVVEEVKKASLEVV